MLQTLNFYSLWKNFNDLEIPRYIQGKTMSLRQASTREHHEARTARGGSHLSERWPAGAAHWLDAFRK